METVNNIAAAASKVIWGDASVEEKNAAQEAALGNETAGTEPKSGELGDVNAGEPYDKGNFEPEPVSDTTANSIATPNDAADTTTKDSGTYLAYRPSEATNTVPKEGVTTFPDIATSSSTSKSAPDSTAKISETNPGTTSAKSLETGEKTAEAQTPSAASTSSNPNTSTTKTSEPETAATSSEYKAPPLTARDQNEHVKGVVGEGAPNTTDEKAGAGRVGVSGVGASQVPTEKTTPAVTSGIKGEAEEVVNGGEASEGKEKLSLKEKIKAKIHKIKE